ncbi:MFS transporter [uncultured Martelella sp.]|uniref:MFS transporter n=1 Tax=uncultured Martelella sp. TaxID=392331 RepID=UPI0029C82F5E|nr:MFS transporter [uncultured Martelella sp.]
MTVSTDSATPSSVPWWRLLNRGHWVVFFLAAMAWLIDCMDQQIFNISRDAAVADLVDKSLAIEYSPYTTSIFLVGWAIGGMILGSLGDRYGRARVLFFAVLMYAACTGLSAASTGFWDFSFYRFITGIGVGGVFGLSVALVADSIPDGARAQSLGVLQSLSAFGNITTGLVGMGIGALAIRGLLPFHLATWQVLFIIGAFPALIILPSLFRLKEPEKWVKAKAEGERKGIKFGSIKTLLSHPTWRKNAWLGMIVSSAGIVGLWGIGNFAPAIVRSIVDTHLANANLTAEAMSSEKAYWAAVGLLLQTTGGFFGMLALSKFAQVKGRRAAAALALLLSFATTVMVFSFMRTTSQMYWMLPIMGFGQYSIFGVYAVYLPELFPTSLRSTGVSFCYNLGRLIAATAPFTIGQITRSLGGNIEAFRTGGIIVSTVLLIGIVVLPFLPETMNRPLPEE